MQQALPAEAAEASLNIRDGPEAQSAGTARHTRALTKCTWRALYSCSLTATVSQAKLAVQQAAPAEAAEASLSVRAGPEVQPATAAPQDGLRAVPLTKDHRPGEPSERGEHSS